MKHIQLNKTLHSWSKEVFLKKGESADGTELELLVIQSKPEHESMLKRVLRNEIQPLVLKEFEGISKIVEAGWDTEQNALWICYPYHEDWVSLADQIFPAKSLLPLFRGLQALKKQNVDGLVICPKHIVGDGQQAALKFVGLSEVWQKYGLLEAQWLSPEVQKGERARLQDDVFSMGKVLEYIGTPKGAWSDSALAENRGDRFDGWKDFEEALRTVLKDAAQAQATTTQIAPSNAPKVLVRSTNMQSAGFLDLVAEMNQECHFWIERELSKKGNQITGLLYTHWFCSRYFIDDRNYIFIPENLIQKRDRSVPSAAIPFDFTFVREGRSLVDLPKTFNSFRETQAGNQLTTNSLSKTDVLRHWRVFPETEKDYVESEALKLHYVSRKKSDSNNKNIIFQFQAQEPPVWEKVKRLKYEGVDLSIDDAVIGKILDFHPIEQFVVIKDSKLDIDEIPVKGEIIQDVRQDISQFKKQVEACSAFEKAAILNADLASMLATPEMIPAPKRLSLDYDEFKEQVINNNLKTDDTQREAVLEAIHRKPLFLIQGPPGTGKTTVIVEMIQQLVRRDPNVKILVTSQSNLAVDNVLERLPEEILFMRLAANEDRIGEKLKAHSFETKLDRWIAETQKQSQNQLAASMGIGKQKLALVEAYKLYVRAKKSEKGFAVFQSGLRIKTVPSYIREKVFGQVSSMEGVKQIFERELGTKVLKLLEIQKEWHQFLDNGKGDAKDARTSKIREGSELVDLHTAFVKSVNVLGATCIHIASSKYSKVDFKFDYVIMDESSKASPAEALVPINMGRNIILIGDHKQLPPVITREEAVREKVKTKLEDNGLDIEKTFGESLFEKIIKSLEGDEDRQLAYRMLDIQYRMPRQVGKLISDYFYDGKLKNPDPQIVRDFDEGKDHGLPFRNPTNMVMVSTSGALNPYDNGVKFSRKNFCNVEKIREILHWLNSQYPDNLARKNAKGEPAPLTIGIIAGYRGQVEELRKRINLKGYGNFQVETGNGEKESLIRINTVDKFQGAEEDIIIYDIVKSSKGCDTIGFLEDYRRINVAFSRVKKLLIVVGDSEYILKRAKLNDKTQFPDFKLKRIVEQFSNEDLIVSNMEDLI